MLLSETTQPQRSPNTETLTTQKYRKSQNLQGSQNCRPLFLSPKRTYSCSALHYTKSNDEDSCFAFWAHILLQSVSASHLLKKYLLFRSDLENMKRNYSALSDLPQVTRSPTNGHTKKRQKKDSASSLVTPWTQGNTASLYSSLPVPTTSKLNSYSEEEKEKRLSMYYHYQTMIRKEVEEVSRVNSCSSQFLSFLQRSLLFFVALSLFYSCTFLCDASFDRFADEREEIEHRTIGKRRLLSAKLER